MTSRPRLIKVDGANPPAAVTLSSSTPAAGATVAPTGEPSRHFGPLVPRVRVGVV
jgi:hypothetical protein